MPSKNSADKTITITGGNVNSDGISIEFGLGDIINLELNISDEANITDHLEPIEGTDFLQTPSEPVDPSDCERWPDSPFCDGSWPFLPETPLGIEIEVSINKCEKCISFTPTVVGFTMAPYTVCKRDPNCIIDEQQPDETEAEVDPNDPSIPIPPENYLEEIEKEFLAKNATIARITWIGTTITHYRRTGDVRRPLEILKIEEKPSFLPPDSLEEGFGPAELSWYPTSFTYNFRMYLPKGFPWRRLIYFGGSSDPFGRQEYFTNTVVRFEQLWWIKNKRYWMSTGYITADGRGGAASFNFMNTRTPGQSSAGSKSVNPRRYPTWIDIYDQDGMEYKPPEKGIRYLPQPQYDDMDCCTESLELIRLLHAKIGTKKLPAVMPEYLLADKGKPIKIETITDFMGWLVKQLDALFGQWPIDIEIEDSDPTQEGNQSKPVRLDNMAEAIAELYGLTLKGATDGDIAINFLMRLASEIIATKNAALITQDYAKANADALGYKGNPTRREVQYSFDPTGIDSLEKILAEKTGYVVGWKNEQKESAFEYFQRFMYIASLWKEKNFKSKGRIADIAKSLTNMASQGIGEDELWNFFVEALNAPTSVFHTATDANPKIEEIKP